MKRFIVLLCLCVFAGAALARSPQEIKSEIQAKRAAIELGRTQNGDVSALKSELARLAAELRKFDARNGAPRLDDGGETCAGATTIASLPFHDSGVLSDEAEDDYGDDLIYCGCNGGDVVYTFTIGENGLPGGIYTISTCGSWFDTVIHLWRNCPDSEEASFVDCNDDAYNDDDDYVCGDDYGYSSCISLSLTVPGTYYIVLDGYCGDYGEYELSMHSGDGCGLISTDCSGLSENSYCETAASLIFDGDAAFASGCTSDGSFPFDLETLCEDDIEACGVWYHVTGTGNTMSATTCDELTNFDTKLFVFTGSCTDLTCVTSNDDGPYVYNEETGQWESFCTLYHLASYVEWCSVEGEDYYIFVSGYDGSTGCFGLTVEDSGEPCTPCEVTDYYFTLEQVPFCQCLTICEDQIQKIFVGPASEAQRPVAVWSNGCGTAGEFPQEGCEAQCSPAYPELYMDWVYLPDRQLWCLDLYSYDGGCYCFCVERVLPVELNSFTAVAGDGQVALEWSTASESNANRFELVRDGATIAQVSATNSATGGTYAWVDRALDNGTTYSYSLVLVDMDGSRSVLATQSATPVEGAGVVNEFALLQNYPNPFNPQTTISFTLPEMANVEVRVFNAVGQEVAVVTKGTFEAGLHSVTFDGSGLTSGIYFYSIKAGEFSAQKKMLLIK
ncbi:T9SS type A sorting domain-containing protein [bacterium]|nr:T9SS type A sorting domain-containing protein [bacterium]